MNTLFISDVHLGARSCRTDKFLKLLKIVEDNPPKQIFIIGDFIDGWKFRRNRFRWGENETKILRRLLKFIQKGIKVVYVAGNHDWFLRDFLDKNMFQNLSIVDEFVLTTPADKKYLITHGDQFDAFIKHRFSNRWLMNLGDKCYETMIGVSKKYMELFNSNFSISKFIKTRFKNAMMYISSFEETLEEHAKRNDCFGVICGHIHCPKVSSDLKYINTGDFVENNSYVVMDDDGNFSLNFIL